MGHGLYECLAMHVPPWKIPKAIIRRDYCVVMSRKPWSGRREKTNQKKEARKHARNLSTYCSDL